MRTEEQLELDGIEPPIYCTPLDKRDLEGRTGNVGCYYCLAVTPVEKVETFDNGDAFCPECGVDSIVDSTDQARLKQLQVASSEPKAR